MYTVRSKTGRVLRRCATRSEAESFVRRQRTARSPNPQRTGALDREYAKAVLYLSVQPDAAGMRFSRDDLASRVGVRRDQAEDEIAKLVGEGLIVDTGNEWYRPTPKGWIWIVGRDKSLRHLLSKVSRSPNAPTFVTLSAGPNPDYENDMRRAPKTRVPVSSFEEASRVCQNFIREHELGGGNWTGGTVTDAKGRVIGRVSYNGRVWPPGKWTSRTKALWPREA
jgi:hypothetical protein